MKIIFDIDGTLTDFNAFIHRWAVPYFRKKYGMPLINSEALEIEDIFQIEQFYISRGMNKEQALEQKKVVLDRFWVSPKFLLFSCLRFRPGAAKLIRKLKKQGFEILIYSSRDKTCRKNAVGCISRIVTYLQCWSNCVFMRPKNICFFSDDQEKLKALKAAGPFLVFDDKPEILEALQAAEIPAICVMGTHNRALQENKLIAVTDNLLSQNVENALQKIFPKNLMNICKKVGKSDKFFEKEKLAGPFVKAYFKTIVLHRENIPKTAKGFIIAPNHQRTLDPIVILEIFRRNIHWAALERFFLGRDSIFNNSKNPFLCRLTAYLFKRNLFFPIIRKKDIPSDQNVQKYMMRNMQAIKDMQLTLKTGSIVGIFPEGTTNKSDTEKFGTFDPAFTKLAVKSESLILPVTILWKSPKRPVVNIGSPIECKGKTAEVVYSQFCQEQLLRYDEVQVYLRGKQ